MSSNTFPHLHFLNTNKDILASHPLPELLQKRIRGFDELKEGLKHTFGEDYDSLLDKLLTLSHELDEELEEYFEHHLENNDLQDEESEPDDMPKPASDKPAKDIVPFLPRMGRADYLSEYQPIDPTIDPKNPLDTEDDKNLIPYKDPEEDPEYDENLLDGLLKGGFDVVTIDELIQMGFHGDLNKGTEYVGKYCLKRVKYSFKYRISLRAKR